MASMEVKWAREREEENQRVEATIKLVEDINREGQNLRGDTEEADQQLAATNREVQELQGEVAVHRRLLASEVFQLLHPMLEIDSTGLGAAIQTALKANRNTAAHSMDWSSTISLIRLNILLESPQYLALDSAEQSKLMNKFIDNIEKAYGVSYKFSDENYHTLIDCRHIQKLFEYKGALRLWEVKHMDTEPTLRQIFHDEYGKVATFIKEQPQKAKEIDSAMADKSSDWGKVALKCRDTLYAIQEAYYVSSQVDFLKSRAIKMGRSELHYPILPRMKAGKRFIELKAFDNTEFLAWVIR